MEEVNINTLLTLVRLGVIALSGQKDGLIAARMTDHLRENHAFGGRRIERRVPTKDAVVTMALYMALEYKDSRNDDDDDDDEEDNDDESKKSCTLEKWRKNLSDMWHNLLSQVDAGLKVGNAYHKYCAKRNSWPKVQASTVRRDASPRRTGGLRGQDAASAGKAD
ncbi:hypothetical protein ISN44_As13g004420 [Arabidopsis suecica]|uniref:Uncharacterized protein n=1 Tax=Arabidopsis suecica TaxID=45249 RepID=A0A8T1XQ44_ARASU|nr:hypothetical protein ISN44_As13g004420 [Arabidopsis suecica]